MGKGRDKPEQNTDKRPGKRGPKTPEGKARALSNLQAPFPPGVSGNPAGRPAAGAVVKEWFNVMAEWSKADLEQARDAADSPAAKVAAARSWLDAMSKEKTSGGQPVAGNDLDRIIDYTHGRPAQTVNHANADGKDFKIIVEYVDRPIKSDA